MDVVELPNVRNSLLVPLGSLEELAKAAEATLKPIFHFAKPNEHTYFVVDGNVLMRYVHRLESGEIDVPQPGPSNQWAFRFTKINDSSDSAVAEGSTENQRTGDVFVPGNVFLVPVRLNGWTESEEDVEGAVAEDSSQKQENGDGYVPVDAVPVPASCVACEMNLAFPPTMLEFYCPGCGHHQASKEAVAEGSIKDQRDGDGFVPGDTVPVPTSCVACGLNLAVPPTMHEFFCPGCGHQQAFGAEAPVPADASTAQTKAPGRWWRRRSKARSS